MKIAEIMTRNVKVASPSQTLREAAQEMSASDVGLLPVGEGDRLVGMVSDRDIAVRGVAAGKGPDAPIREVMTADIKYCFDDEEVEHVTGNMGDIQVRRLPVLNRSKQLVGIVSLADFARHRASKPHAGHALSGVSEPR